MQIKFCQERNGLFMKKRFHQGRKFCFIMKIENNLMMKISEIIQHLKVIMTSFQGRKKWQLWSDLFWKVSIYTIDCAEYITWNKLSPTDCHCMFSFGLLCRYSNLLGYFQMWSVQCWSYWLYQTSSSKQIYNFRMKEMKQSYLRLRIWLDV